MLQNNGLKLLTSSDIVNNMGFYVFLTKTLDMPTSKLCWLFCKYLTSFLFSLSFNFPSYCCLIKLKVQLQVCPPQFYNAKCSKYILMPHNKCCKNDNQAAVIIMVFHVLLTN